MLVLILHASLKRTCQFLSQLALSSRGQEGGGRVPSLELKPKWRPTFGSVRLSGKPTSCDNLTCSCPCFERAPQDHRLQPCLHRSRATKGCLVVLAGFTTTSISASFLGVHPSECKKKHGKDPHTSSDIHLRLDDSSFFPRNGRDRSYFFVDHCSQVAVNCRKNFFWRMFAVFTAGTHLTLSRVLRSCIIFCLCSSISCFLVLCSVPK